MLLNAIAAVVGALFVAVVLIGTLASTTVAAWIGGIGLGVTSGFLFAQNFPVVREWTEKLLKELD